MQFRLGAIPDSEDFVPDASWKPLREPGPWVAQLFAAPLGCVLFVFTGFLWLKETNVHFELMLKEGFLLLGFASFAPLVVAHEIVHGLTHPQWGRSKNSIFGFWPSKLLFYAHYDGEMTRNRFILILAMPVIVITAIPLIVATFTPCAHALIAWVSTWNILFGCLDILGIIFLMVQVPSGAICRNKGWRTYWRINAR